MDFLLVLILIGAVAFFASFMQAKTVNNDDKLVLSKKKCPPHSWTWQEIVDQDGTKQGERIVCKVCGPLSKSLEGSIE